MKIGEISQLRGTAMQTVSPKATVHQAIQKLAEYNIGALPVTAESGELVGIITERDILRLCARQDCHQMMEREVGEVMTKDLVIGVPDDDIDYALRVMTDKRIRHLPVLDGQKLLDIISIGDLVKTKLDVSSTEIRFLRDYVTGAA